MIVLTKKEVQELMLNQQFYTYFEIPTKNVLGQYFTVTREVLGRNDLKISIYYKMRKPTWFNKLFKFTQWDIDSVAVPFVNTGSEIVTDLLSDPLDPNKKFNGFRKKTIKDILKMIES